MYWGLPTLSKDMSYQTHSRWYSAMWLPTQSSGVALHSSSSAKKLSTIICTNIIRSETATTKKHSESLLITFNLFTTPGILFKPLAEVLGALHIDKRRTYMLEWDRVLYKLNTTRDVITEPFQLFPYHIVKCMTLTTLGVWMSGRAIGSPCQENIELPAGWHHHVV